MATEDPFTAIFINNTNNTGRETYISVVVSLFSM